MRLTLVGWMAVAAFALSFVLLIYVLGKESPRQDDQGFGPWPPQLR